MDRPIKNHRHFAVTPATAKNTGVSRSSDDEGDDGRPPLISSDSENEPVKGQAPDSITDSDSDDDINTRESPTTLKSPFPATTEKAERSTTISLPHHGYITMKVRNVRKHSTTSQQLLFRISKQRPKLHRRNRRQPKEDSC